METKFCRACKIEKSLSEFSTGSIRNGKKRIATYCKLCFNLKYGNPRKPKGDTQVCKKCGIEKPLIEYHKVGIRNGKQRYQRLCKVCFNKARRKTIRPRSGDTSKVCTGCHKLKQLKEFSPNTKGALGRTSRCRKCIREAEQIRLHGHKLTYTQKPLFIFSKVCKRCNTEKPIEDFYPDRMTADRYRRFCKTCDFEAAKTYYHDNNEYVRKRARGYRPRWYAENIERERARSQKKYQANPEMYYARSAKRRARKKAAVTEAIHYSRILKQYGFICHICGGTITSKSDLHFDHVIPLARGGSHTENNIKPSHKVCNLRKGDKLIEDLSDFQRRGP